MFEQGQQEGHVNDIWRVDPTSLMVIIKDKPFYYWAFWTYLQSVPGTQTSRAEWRQ